MITARYLFPKVLLPYKFTLLSNMDFLADELAEFYYPINLHYSQTGDATFYYNFPFYYPINLHYSQTL